MTATLTRLSTAAYVTGRGPVRHAITRAEAIQALEVADATLSRAETRPVCQAAPVGVNSGEAVFDRSNPWLRGLAVCPACLWTIAIAEADIAGELAAWHPAAEQMPARRRLMADPLLVSHLCEAIIAAAAAGTGAGLDDPTTIQVLAAACEHAPTLLMPGEHQATTDLRPADSLTDYTAASRRGFPGASLACPACSLRTPGQGGHRGRSFLSQCTVPGPCQVLRILAGHYGLPNPTPGGDIEIRRRGQC